LEEQEDKSQTANAEPRDEPFPVCWFEDEETGMPLRWHLLAGVLFDLRPIYWKRGGGIAASSSSSSSLPWRLRLHFNNYPSSQLLPLSGPDAMAAVRASYRHSLKQALCLCAPTASVGGGGGGGGARAAAALGISRDAHERLWESIRTGNYGLWRQVHDEGNLGNLFLVETAPSAGADRLDPDSTARTASGSSPTFLLPIRVLCNSRPPIQRRCSPVKAVRGSALDDSSIIGLRKGGGQGELAVLTTLGDLLASWLPDLFRAEIVAESDAVTAAPDAVDESAGIPAFGKRERLTVPAERASAANLSVRPRLPPTELEWRVSGLSNLPLKTPLLPLWTELSHPDHFLYISVVTAPPQAS
jgi:hypothetical protein